MAPDSFSLRDVWDANFKRFEDKLDGIQEDVAELKSLTSRVSALESAVCVLKWLGGVLTAIALGLLVPALRGWLGL